MEKKTGRKEEKIGVGRTRRAGTRGDVGKRGGGEEEEGGQEKKGRRGDGSLKRRKVGEK